MKTIKFTRKEARENTEQESYGVGISSIQVIKVTFRKEDTRIEGVKIGDILCLKNGVISLYIKVIRIKNMSLTPRLIFLHGKIIEKNEIPPEELQQEQVLSGVTPPRGLVHYATVPPQSESGYAL